MTDNEVKIALTAIENLAEILDDTTVIIIQRNHVKMLTQFAHGDLRPDLEPSEFVDLMSKLGAVGEG